MAEILQVSIVVPALLYLVGLAVTNFHLSRYGVTSFALLRIQHIVAGLWCMLPPTLLISLGAMWYGAFSEVFDPSNPPRGIGPALRAIWAGIEGLCASSGFILLLVICTCIVFKIRLHFENLKSLISRHSVSVVKLVVLILATGGSLSIAVHNFDAARSAPTIGVKVEEFSLGIANSTFSAFFAYLYLAYFATRIYPVIPYALGGGKPLLVTFLLDPVCSCPFQLETTQRSVKYELLLATATSYFVHSKNQDEQSVEITRALVHSVIISKPIGPQLW